MTSTQNSLIGKFKTDLGGDPYMATVLILSLLLWANIAYPAAQGKYDEAEGKYLDPQVKTNINKVDPLFDENIKSYQNFEKDMLEHKKNIAAGIKQGIGTKDSAGSSDAQKVANDLSKVSANDLEAKGRRKGSEDAWLNEIFVDYSKPGNQQIKQDMEDIAKASNNMMSVILSQLKDLGVDCKSAKGNVQIEPQYYIELKNRSSRDKGETVYDQFYCEQPRREYDCIDEATVTCTEKGMKWGLWQDKEITVPGLELVGLSENVFHIDHDADKVFNYKLFVAPTLYASQTHYYYPDPAHILAMRRFLATKHPNSTVDHISDQMKGRMEGGTFSISGRQHVGRTLGHKDYAYHRYVINYKYRDGRLSCLKWSEDWGEECKLKQ